MDNVAIRFGRNGRIMAFTVPESPSIKDSLVSSRCAVPMLDPRSVELISIPRILSPPDLYLLLFLILPLVLSFDIRNRAQPSTRNTCI